MSYTRLLDRAYSDDLVPPSGPGWVACPAYSIALSPAHGPEPLPPRDSRRPKGVTSIQCPTTHPSSANWLPPVPQHSTCHPTAPMNQHPADASVQKVLRATGSNVMTVEAVRPLPSARLQRVYEVKLVDHDPLVLVLEPPAMLRLLRSEQWLIRSEAEAARWIRSALSGGDRAAPIDGRILCDELECISSSTGGRASEKYVAESADDLDLLKLLPSLLCHSQASNVLGSAFNLLSRTPGQAISSLPKPLTGTERKHVDFETGRLVRRLSQLTSPSGKFGPLVAVLTPPPDFKPLGGADNACPFYGQGASNWSAAFQSILEGVLRDGEDMAVTVAYSAIRRHFRRFGHLLDGVTIPRLVIIDAAEDSNTMVVLSRTGDPQLLRDARLDIHELCRDEDDFDEQQKTPGEESTGTTSEVVVAGLRDWSSCIFADPLMATVFCTQPSAEFYRGFSGRTRDGKDDETRPEFDLIEDRDSADIRLLLYQCYHATSAIVREFYRPQIDSTSRELAARRKLSEVLAKLERVEEDPKRRHRRPSAELSPAKRPKSADHDGNTRGAQNKSG